MSNPEHVKPWHLVTVAFLLAVRLAVTLSTSWRLGGPTIQEGHHSRAFAVRGHDGQSRRPLAVL